MAGVSMDNVSNLSPELQKAFQNAMKMEQRPIQAIEERKGNAEAKSKLLGDVIGKVEAVKKSLTKLSADNVRELSFASADEKVVTGTAEKGAAPGKFEVEVLQLAEPPRALSNGFPDKDSTRIGSGYFTFETATGESKEVFIDNDNATLDGVAQAINGARLGVRASVVRDESDPENPFRLSITGLKPGATQDVEYPDFYFVDGEQDLYIENQRPATNAVVRYDGFEIETPANELKDLIPGVTLKLRGLSEPGRPVTVDVDMDIPKAKAKVKEMVDGLNQVFSFIQGQNNMDDKTPTEKTLGGDYGIRVAEDRLRRALQPLFPAGSIGGDGNTIRMLSDIGIQFSRQGTLTLDEKKLDTALNSDFEGVATFLGGDGLFPGLVPKIEKTLGTITGGNGGVLTNQQKDFTEKIKRMQSDIDDKEKALSQRSEDLKNKLSKAQAALNSVQTQSAAISAQLGGGGATLPQMR